MRTKCCPSLEVWQGVPTLRFSALHKLDKSQMSEKFVVALAQCDGAR